MTIENDNFIVYHYDLPAPIYASHNLLIHKDFKFDDTDINLVAASVFSCQQNINDANNIINRANDAIADLKEVVDRLNVNNLPIKFNLNIEGANRD